MKITIERAAGTKVHIEGDEESVTRIARELSPPPVQPIQIPYIPTYPGIDTWRLGRPWWDPGVTFTEPKITWTTDSVGALDAAMSDYVGGTYSTGQPS